MKSSKVKAVSWFVVILSIFLFTQFKNKVIENRFVLEDSNYNPYILPVSLAKLLSFGDSRLISNLYWLKLINYLGSRHYRGPEVQHRAAYPMAELIIDLDPEFDYAYEIAGVILSSKTHYFTRIMEANCIFQRAHKVFPKSYTFYFWHAFNLIWLFGEEDESVEMLYKAAPYAPAPEVTIGIANRIIAKQDRYENAADMLKDAYENAVEEDVKENIKKQIIWLNTQRQLSGVNEQIKKFNTDKGRWPQNLQELAETGYIARLPREPFGGHFFINEDRQIESSVVGWIAPWTKDAPYKEMYLKYKDVFKCHEPGGELIINWPTVEMSEQ